MAYVKVNGIGAHKDDGYTSLILGKYLETASHHNVIAVFSALQDRWRLQCRKCGGILSFPDRLELEHEYVRNGALPQDVAEFARNHRHTKESEALILKKQADSAAWALQQKQAEKEVEKLIAGEGVKYKITYISVPPRQPQPQQAHRKISGRRFR